MNSILNHLRQRWHDWTGDKEMELAIRRELHAAGYFGSTAQLRGVRLVAVQRPGWLQVFRFETTARVKPIDPTDDDGPEPEPRYVDLFGLIREDIRRNDTTIRLFEDEEERAELFTRWSKDLIVHRGGVAMKKTTTS